MRSTGLGNLLKFYQFLLTSTLYLCGRNSPVMLLRADSGRGISAPARPLWQRDFKNITIFIERGFAETFI